MVKNLVIVESPAKAKTIKKYLGKDYEIKASFGHVRDLPERTLGVKIDDNFEPKYTELKDKAKILDEFRKLSKKMDTVYIATDPDREGEAIAWHISESIAKDSKNIKRIVFNEITKNAITSAIDHSRDIDQDLVDAQQARRILDRLIGYKLSPILSRKIKKGLSAGRVQSVAVKLVCDREREINAFVPEEYWIIDGNFEPEGNKNPFSAACFAKDSPDNKLKITNEEQAKAVVDAVQETTWKVHDLQKQERKRNPFPPFITSTMQQEASKKLNWSAKKTMMMAQQLYEGIEIDGEAIGLITYMRTDSVRIANDAMAASRDFVKTKYGDKYLPEKPRHFKTKASAQDAHEAIRPTYIEKSPADLKDKLSTDHYKLYKLIWERLIASQMQPALFEQTQVILEAQSSPDKYYFKTTGNVMLFDGFMVLYNETKDEHETEEAEMHLPSLTVGESVSLKDLKSEQKFTQPPHRFTEASLVKVLEEKGIGRPSTYAPTLSTVTDRGYVDKQKRTLFPTELGLIVDEKLGEFFNKIIDIDFTAAMEQKLDEIMEGKHQWQKVVEEIYTPFTGMLDVAYEKMEKVNRDKPTDIVCDQCGEPMVIKEGRYGEFLACTGFPDCKNTKPMPQKPLEDCPKCSKHLVERRTKRKKIFYGCSGYPECNFASWDPPIEQTCPECNAKTMFVKKAYKGKKEETYCALCKEDSK